MNNAQNWKIFALTGVGARDATTPKNNHKSKSLRYVYFCQKFDVVINMDGTEEKQEEQTGKTISNNSDVPVDV